MTTGIVYHRAYLLHEQSPTHPERRERLAYTIDQLDEEGIWDLPEITRLDPYPAPEEAVLAVHIPEYVTFLQEASRGGGFIDPDTSIPPGLWDFALLAAGGAMRAGDAVLDREVANAFALVRPPGHHARMGTGAGFCCRALNPVFPAPLKRRRENRV